MHVEYTKLFVEKPREIAVDKPPAAQLHYDDHGDRVIEIGAILAHKRKHNTFYFLALPANAPTHYATL